MRPQTAIPAISATFAIMLLLAGSAFCSPIFGDHGDPDGMRWGAPADTHHRGWGHGGPRHPRFRFPSHRFHPAGRLPFEGGAGTGFADPQDGEEEAYLPEADLDEPERAGWNDPAGRGYCPHPPVPAVPEPNSLALIGAGVLGLLAARAFLKRR